MNRNSFINRWREELLAGISGGLLLALSFPPFPTRFLSLVALVPPLGYFIVGKKRGNYLRRGFALGFVFGVAFFLVLLFWINNLIPESSARMPWLMIPALLLLVLYLSCYPALFSLVLSFFVRRFGKRFLFAAPALWSLTEFIRSRGELGFSWGVISNSLVKYPEAIQGLSFYGPFGLSLFIVLVNLLVAFAVFERSRSRRVWLAVSVAVLIGVHLVWGALVIRNFDRKMERAEDGCNVAIVQPNVNLGIKWNPVYRDTIFQEIEEWTLEAAGRGVQLVIFPETAAPVSMSNSPRYFHRLTRLTREADVDLLIGYVDHHFKGDNTWLAYNSAGLFDSRGLHTAQYNKVNLLPFGERIPFSQYLPFLGRLDFGQANFESGKVRTLFHSRLGRFGVLICFESTFSDYTRRYVLEGADFLVNITNDGWFGSGRGPVQHAETAILRAVENRVTLLRSANTGISMLVDPVGRVRKRLGLDHAGMILGSIFPSGDLSIYCRHGHLVFFLVALMNLVIAAVLSLSRVQKI